MFFVSVGVAGFTSCPKDDDGDGGGGGGGGDGGGLLQYESRAGARTAGKTACSGRRFCLGSGGGRRLVRGGGLRLKKQPGVWALFVCSVCRFWG